MNNLLLRVIFPLGIVGASLLCSGTMIAFRPKAEQTNPGSRVLTVETVRAVSSNNTPMLRSSGVIKASQDVQLVPEVTGRVVSISDNLHPGMAVKKGQVLARLDSRDYSLAVEQSKAEVRSAELELELEIGRQQTANKEWELLRGDKDKKSAPLALRGPQQRVALQRLESAKSNLQRAQIALSRTTLKAPFDGQLISESLEVGQVVSQAKAVARIVGSGEYWVVATLSPEKVQRVQLPADGQPGATAIIKLDGQEHSIAGTVIELLAELESESRSAQLLISIPPETTKGTFLPGAWVDVEIAGMPIKDSIQVPRTALYGNNTVWLVDKENKLMKREVKVAYEDAEFAWIKDGLTANDQLVVSSMSLPQTGLSVSVLSEDK